MSSSNSTDSVAAAFDGMSGTEIQQMIVYLYYGNSANDSLGFSLGELDGFYHNQLIPAIHSGARIGSSAVVSIIMFLVARTYRSTLFCMYQMNFFLMILGSALELGWIFSFNGSLSAYMTNTVPYHRDLSVSMAASVILTLLMLSLLATLVLQIYIACSDQPRRVQLAVTLVSSIGCFPAYFVCLWRLTDVGIQLFGPQHGQNSYGPGFIDSSTYNLSSHSDWAYNGAWRSFAASCSFCSLILCTKLYIVHRNRAKIGIEQFNPIRILLIMALQNSVIASVLAIISSCISSNDAGGQSISAAAIPVAACMLPTGYIWAQHNMIAESVQNDEENARKSPTKDVRDDYSDYMSANPYVESPTSEFSSNKNNHL